MDPSNRRQDTSVHSLNGSFYNGNVSGGGRTPPLLLNGRLKTPRPSSMCESGSLRYDVRQIDLLLNRSVVSATVIVRYVV